MSSIVPHNFEGLSVRTVQIEDKTYFVGKDAASALGYADTVNALKQHCKGMAKYHPLQTDGGMQNVRVIDEPDLMRLVVNSTLPSAERFERWVFEDVLPSIRKTGGYSVAPRETGPLLPATYADALRALADKVEETQRIETERDHAIATKAEIGSRREATAMATASAKSRQVARLQHELGRNAHHATMIAVEKASGRKFGDHDWRPLKKYCKEHDLHPETVPDKRYGESKAWPAAAWHAVYGIDLRELFPSAELEAA